MICDDEIVLKNLTTEYLYLRSENLPYGYSFNLSSKVSNIDGDVVIF